MDLVEVDKAPVGWENEAMFEDWRVWSARSADTYAGCFYEKKLLTFKIVDTAGQESCILNGILVCPSLVGSELFALNFQSLHSVCDVVVAAPREVVSKPGVENGEVLRWMSNATGCRASGSRAMELPAGEKKDAVRGGGILGRSWRGRLTPDVRGVRHVWVGLDLGRFANQYPGIVFRCCRSAPGYEQKLGFNCDLPSRDP